MSDESPEWPLFLPPPGVQDSDQANATDEIEARAESLWYRLQNNDDFQSRLRRSLMIHQLMVSQTT